MSNTPFISTKKCLICEKQFEYRSSKATYCSKYCNHLAYRKRNPEKVKKRRNNWYASDLEARAEYRKTMSEYHRKYWRDRRSNDEVFKIRNYLRSRLNQVLTGKIKNGSAVKDLGCSIEELKSHLESKFTEGMAWDNYGEWHIDHIRPLASFDLENREDLLKACHYTNLQPLWARDNLKKGDKND